MLGPRAPGDSCAPDGRWHHLAYTKTANPTPQRTLYLDGEVVLLSRNGGAAIDADRTYANGSALVLGQDQDSFGGGFQASQAFRGSMTELRFWNVARTQLEIRDAMFMRLQPDAVSTCDAVREACRNTVGGFECDCAPGFLPPLELAHDGFSLHVPGPTLWPTGGGVGNVWRLSVRAENQVELQGWQGQYLTAPSGAPAAREGAVGVDAVWTYVTVRDNVIKLQSWEGTWLTAALQLSATEGDAQEWQVGPAA
eukprot:357072-Rhodomonas_salina.1